MDRLVAGATKLGLGLSPQQLEQFQIFYRELVDWNRRFNLTAITEYEEVQMKHFLDSLTVTLALTPPTGGRDCRVIDVGTGAGLPGIPLKILCPGIRLVLLDATAKKSTFLHHLKGELGLEDIEIVIGRAEEIAHLGEYRERFDLVLSRAVANLPALAELALPFCAIGGSFIAQRKGAVEKEALEADKACRVLGGKLSEIKSIKLDELGDDRYLVVIDKISPTPGKYPRRPGIPAKRPLV
ncbi:16S rRNA (guanine(527)-N(7))-methyltransferase RsmG [Chloroflexota bacterium]